MSFKKYSRISFCLAVFSIFLAGAANAQQTRSRVVQPAESQPINTLTTTGKINRTVLSAPTTSPNQRPTLTNQIVVTKPNPEPLVKNISSSKPTNPAAANNLAPAKSVYSAPLVSNMLKGIQTRYGIPYLMGSTGPNRYDCSGFVWSVFNDAGILFERASARTYWEQFEPVSGDDRFKFGTLVFFNRLGHVGIVADENGFYHASSSKGITYSTFKGYWEKRIVGFRRVPMK